MCVCVCVCVCVKYERRKKATISLDKNSPFRWMTYIAAENSEFTHLFNKEVKTFQNKKCHQRITSEKQIDKKNKLKSEE